MKLKQKLLAIKETIFTGIIKADAKIREFAVDERGDTNFISIIVILGIVLLVAGVFMLFKDQIITQAQAIIDSFTIR